MAKESFLVIGAGAWGTALSVRLAKNGLRVSLTSRDKENLSIIMSEINQKDLISEILLFYGSNLVQLEGLVYLTREYITRK